MTIQNHRKQESKRVLPKSDKDHIWEYPIQGTNRRSYL